MQSTSIRGQSSQKSGLITLACLALSWVGGAVLIVYSILANREFFQELFYTAQGLAGPVLLAAAALGLSGLLYRSWQGMRIRPRLMNRAAWFLSLVVLAAALVNLARYVFAMTWTRFVLRDTVLISLLLVIVPLLYLAFVLAYGPRAVSRIADTWWLGLFALLGGGILFAANAIVPALAALALFAAAGIAGFSLMKLARLREPFTGLESLLTGLGVGLGFFGLLALSLGKFGWLYAWLIWFLYAGLAGLGWLYARTELRGIFLELRHAVARPRISTRPAMALLVLTVLIIWMVSLVGSLGPEVQSDALGGRLSNALMFARSHSVKINPMRLVSYWPMGNEMLFTLAVSTGGLLAAKLVHFGMGLLCLLALAVLGRRMLNWQAGVLAAFIFGGASVVWFLLDTAYSDLTFTFYGLAACTALFRWFRQPKDMKLLALFALLAGFQGGVKLSAVLMLAAAAVPIGLLSLRGEDMPGRRGVLLLLRNLALVSAFTLVGTFPWLLRTFLATWNPVFPFLPTIFPGQPWADKTIIYSRRYVVGNDLKAYLALPYTMVFKPSLLVEAGGFHPMLLFAAVSALGGVFFRRKDWPVILFVFLYCALWAFTDANLRYAVLPISLFAILAAVLALDFLGRVSSGVAQAVQHSLIALLACVGTILVLSTLWWWDGYSSIGFPYRVVFGLKTQDAYLAEKLAHYPALAYLNRTYGEKAHVLSLFDRDFLYLRSDFMVYGIDWVGKRDQLGGLLYAQMAPEEVYRQLKDLGFTHLLVQAEYYNQLSLRDAERPTIFTDAFLHDGRFVEVEYAARGYYLYHLLPEENAAGAAGKPHTLLAENFEEPLTGWEFSGEPLLFTDARKAHGQNGSIEVNRDAMIARNVPVIEGHLYELDYFSQAAVETAYVVNWIEWSNREGEVLSSTYLPYRVAGDYREIRFYETAPAGATQVRITVKGHDTAPSRLDDLTFLLLK